MTQVERFGADARVFFGREDRRKMAAANTHRRKYLTARALEGDVAAKARLAGIEQKMYLSRKSGHQKAKAEAKAKAVDRVARGSVRVSRVNPATGKPRSLDLPITQRCLSKLLDWLASPGTKMFPHNDLEPWQFEFLRSGRLPSD